MIRKVADRLFKWYCNPEYYPDIQGDLEELYSDHLEQNKNLAGLKYLADVILLFRPALIRPLFKNSIINSAMFRNYLKISIRNLQRHKVYTAINVIGLAIGLAGFLLINEYVNFEKSYDSFHHDADQIHRIGNLSMSNGAIEVKDAMASYLAGKVLQDEIPEITNHTVTRKLDRMILRNAGSTYIEKGGVSADARFFDFFNYKVLQGDVDHFFDDPHAVVLTQSKAKSYFGDANPVGQTIEMLTPNKVTLKVTGLLEDIPANTHYPFDFLVSDGIMKEREDYENWNYNNYYVYVKVQEGSDMAALNEKLHQASLKQFGDDTSEFFDAYPMQDIYLKSDYSYEPHIMGSQKAVTFLTVISIFILVIAWVNYVNLSTARAVDRAKEVGLRKVVGAFKRQLIGQFLFESFFINALGAIVALFLAQLALPYFNILVGKELVGDVWNYWPFLRSLLIFTVAGTIISGVYPSLILSSFQPVTVLKGKFRNSKQGVYLRKGLVVLQFTASLVLIASTFTVYRQVQFMKGTDKGINIDYVVSLTVPRPSTPEERKTYQSKIKSFKEELRTNPDVLFVGGTSNLPGGGHDDINATTDKLKVIGKSDFLEGTTYMQWNDDHFMHAVGMQLVAGRNFDREMASDSAAMIPNQSFLRRHGISDDKEAIGLQVRWGEHEKARKYNIVGVVKDWNRTSLKTKVEPTVYMPWMNPRSLAIKLNPENYKQAIKFIDTKWSEFYPNVPLTYSFLDERFDALYREDEKFGNVFAVFSTFAILVAMLGLFGLASFLSIQRTKEVGIRKVLGAEISQIVVIFFKDFIWLLGIAAIIGIPLIYFSMDQWLNNYAYRIDFPWALAALSLFIVVAFALGTVGYQIYKVAVISPSRTLKYE